ncbi:hypothetical protein FRC10_004883 [Ceratobasidium sp. 414]|nr:hypothetical protein FRC10_004883 [Ceratobasidium sp. 414]
MTTCESENAEAVDQSSFWDEAELVIVKRGMHWDAHRIGWAVSGAFALAAVLVTIVSVSRHARNYHVPKEQRQIILPAANLVHAARIRHRQLVFVPIFPGVYVSLSSSSIELSAHLGTRYYSFAVVVYEAFTISAFLLLIIQYVANTSSGKTAEGALERKNKKKLPLPVSDLLTTFCFWRYRPTKAYFMYTIKWSVLQYVIIRPAVSIAGIVCQALGVLCQSSWSYKHPGVYLSAVDFVSISVALYGLQVLFYGLTKDELVGRRPLAKFLTIKLIVMATFYQEFVFNALQKHGVIKPTQYWTASNIADGLNALATTIEMVIFACFMMWAYPVSEYARPDLPKTSVGRPIIDSLNFSDFAIEIWGSLRFFWDSALRKPHTRGSNHKDSMDFGEAFGVRNDGGVLRTRGGVAANTV